MINTENTAAINAANQANAMNLLSLSNFALSAMWQEFRDEAFWAWTSGENELDRAHNLAIAAFNRQTLFDQIDSIYFRCIELVNLCFQTIIKLSYLIFTSCIKLFSNIFCCLVG